MGFLHILVPIMIFLAIAGLIEIVQERRESLPSEWIPVRAKRLKLAALCVLALVLGGWWLLLESLAVVLVK